MSLTINEGPLVTSDPPPSNYAIEGPRHRLLWSGFPRRVRGELRGETVFDTRAGRLLHESQMLPRLYVPRDDVRVDLLEPTETTTHCPFKGDASYWSIAAGDARAEDAAWSYLQPNPETPWLADHFSFYLEALDALYDEAEQVHGHLRDPFHRVDVRRYSAPATVRVGERTLVETDRALVLSETGLANRLYFPREEIDSDLLLASEKRTHCPYKGDATYWSVTVDGETYADAAWSYEEPLEDAAKMAAAVCFDHERIEIIGT